MSKATSNRGVWKAPWRGPRGEIVLFVMDSKAHLVVDPVTIPMGGDHVGVADRLWDVLDAAEPRRPRTLGLSPKFTRVHRAGSGLSGLSLKLVGRDGS